MTAITITLEKPFMNETVWDLDGYVTNLRGDALKEAARELGISFKSKTPVAEIRQAIRDHYVSAHEVNQPESVPGAQAKLWPQSELEIDLLDEARNANLDRPLTVDEENAIIKKARARKSTSAHMPNSERVQVYIRGSEMLYPKLTHRQMRRIRKHANKHGERFLINYFHTEDNLSVEFPQHSLLARTPEGLGIFHKIGA